MAVRFHPKQAQILVCDFTGFILPEMIKRRPVVIVSPRLRRREGLCTIVPLSTTSPKTVMPYHCQISSSLPKPWNNTIVWVKCDMIYTVSYERLFVIHGSKNEAGKYINENYSVSCEEMGKIQKAMAFALDFKNT